MTPEDAVCESVDRATENTKRLLERFASAVRTELERKARTEPFGRGRFGSEVIDDTLQDVANAMSAGLAAVRPAPTKGGR